MPMPTETQCPPIGASGGSDKGAIGIVFIGSSPPSALDPHDGGGIGGGATYVVVSGIISLRDG